MNYRTNYPNESFAVTFTTATCCYGIKNKPKLQIKLSWTDIIFVI